ncbi:hypothetical protein MAR_020760 [Mya arenaria]|uniref:Uncharacterized protein n=1 Tax=Mya arenaria TaxID=6604 RepID=A0ABY7E902_MYAAR|nr:hypothetical protein MAR_020760 [Mya arenaria]
MSGSYKGATTLRDKIIDLLQTISLKQQVSPPSGKINVASLLKSCMTSSATCHEIKKEVNHDLSAVVTMKVLKRACQQRFGNFFDKTIQLSFSFLQALPDRTH